MQNTNTINSLSFNSSTFSPQFTYIKHKQTAKPFKYKQILKPSESNVISEGNLHIYQSFHVLNPNSFKPNPKQLKFLTKLKIDSIKCKTTTNHQIAQRIYLQNLFHSINTQDG